MLIRTCNAMKTNYNDQLYVQHTTNAKYTIASAPTLIPIKCSKMCENTRAI